MEAIKYIVDETGKQTEVVIPIKLWEKIRLSEYITLSNRMNKELLQQYIGIIKLKIDPLEYQRGIRNEW